MEFTIFSWCHLHGGDLNAEQARFDYFFSSARMTTIERAFGKFKVQFDVFVLPFNMFNVLYTLGAVAN